MCARRVSSPFHRWWNWVRRAPVSLKKSSKPEIQTHPSRNWFWAHSSTAHWFVWWVFLGKQNYVRRKLSHYLQIKHGKQMCASVNARGNFWSFYSSVRELEKVPLVRCVESSWRTLKVVGEKVNWFLSSGTMRHEVSMVVFRDNCMLLPAALHFDSHFHSCFHEQQK